MDEIFSSSGPIARTHPMFEEREGQLAMAKAVEEALMTNNHLAVQAGTGLGKTFAYLVPALRFALAHKKRVIVSTRTLSLQEQLIQKDIPFLKQAIGNQYPFIAVVAKGRGNYVCRFKMERLEGFDRGLFTSLDEVESLRGLRIALSSGGIETGDREELGRLGSEVWSFVAGDGESCLRRSCPFFSSCYYYAARRAQSKADLVIVNHALYFSDLAIRMESDFETDQAVLEDYDAVVFDEAHNLEDVATDFLGRAVDANRVKRVTAYLVASFREGGLAYKPERESFATQLETVGQKANSAAIAFFSQFPETRRLFPGDITGIETVDACLDELRVTLVSLTGTGINEEETAVFSALQLSAASLLGDYRHVVSLALPDHAYWAEVGSGRTALRSAPISLEEKLKEGIFDRVGSVILTSATLSSALLRRVGVQDCPLLRLESPFDYRHNCLLYLPDDAMAPASHAYDDYTARKVLEIAKESRGRALVLFTSYKAMNAVYDAVNALCHGNFTVLRQGDTTQRELVRRFLDAERPILLAVASYWEGIDIPGEDLSAVIIVKLPFAVPTEPITEARFEKIRERKGDPFNEYSLPQAVLRLKQGFGRLIRSKADRGVVAVLDERLQTRYYGRKFIRDLPPARIVTRISDIADFFSDKIVEQ
ncbi:MAG TPA: helicase C-terminal domain-containing protein [Bacillota bacterium]|nr:helicase C-terminal domain-containing protein [Bacillota bacterium]